MRNGTTQIVEISSTPAGSTARIQPTGVEIVTPDSVQLRRKTAYYTVNIKKDGYESIDVKLVRTTSGLWRDWVLCIYPPVGIAGLIVDTTSGAGYEHQPQKIDVKLVPAQEAERQNRIVPSGNP